MVLNKIQDNVRKTLCNTETKEHRILEMKEMLIKSMHSSSDAKCYFANIIKKNDIKDLECLIEIAGDLDDFGDAPIKASYFIKEYPKELLKIFEEDMINILLNDDRWARKFLAIALAKIKSEKAKEYIYRESDDWIFAEAVKLYESD